MQLSCVLCDSTPWLVHSIPKRCVKSVLVAQGSQPHNILQGPWRNISCWAVNRRALFENAFWTYPQMIQKCQNSFGGYGANPFYYCCQWSLTDFHLLDWNPGECWRTKKTSWDQLKLGQSLMLSGYPHVAQEIFKCTQHSIMSKSSHFGKR